MKMNNNTDRKEFMRSEILNKPVLSLLLKMSVPTIIGMLITVIYNLTDTFFVGLLNDRSMTAAIGIVFSYVSMIQAVGFWFGYGSGNIMSKKLGEQNEKEANIISYIGIIFALTSGIIIMIMSMIFIENISGFIGGDASENLLYFTNKYLKVIIISIPFSLYAITVYNQLRLCGNIKAAISGLLLGMFANMILDPVFIFLFRFGFIGAGYATLIGHIIGCFALSLSLKSSKKIPTGFKDIRCNKERDYHILAGGMPNFSRQAITGIALVLINKTAAAYGDAMIAALTVSSRIIALAYMIMIGWGQGFQPICAMNFGAEKYERVKEAFNLALRVGTIFLVISAIVIYIIPVNFIKLMSNDEDVIEIGIKILRMQCMTMPLLGYYAMSSMLMQNTGRYLQSLTILVARQGIFYIPLIYILIAIYGKTGIYVLQPVADVLSFCLSFIIVNKNRKYIGI